RPSRLYASCRLSTARLDCPLSGPWIQGDLLALALKRALRRKYVFGEVPGSVRLRRRKAQFGGLRQWHRALAAELMAGRIRRVTRRAAGREGPTHCTELSC